jgi:hypothetical protein
MADITQTEHHRRDFASASTRCWPGIRSLTTGQQTSCGMSSPRSVPRRWALIEFTARFDGWQPTRPGIWRSRSSASSRPGDIPADQREALQTAADRVRAYAERQKMEGWSYTEADGTLLGQQVTPLDRVGLYVPGGKAAYPSSVLMNAIPAKVAGVGELIMVVPTPGGELNELVLAAAARLLGSIGPSRSVAPRRSRRSPTAPNRCPAVRQDRRAGQHLCRHRQARGVRPGRHRHGRRPLRDPGDLRRRDRPGLDRDGPVLAGRARRRRPVHPAVPGTRSFSSGSRRASTTAADDGPAARSSRPRCEARGALILCRDLDDAADGGQRHCTGAPRAVGRRPRRSGSEDSPCRRHLHGAPHRRGRSATTAPARTMSCRHPAPPASRRRSASTTSRSARA